MAYDVREVANFLLDIATTEDISLSNLSANKIVYFLHAYYLVQFNRPLVSAKIEAWDYGPVFRELYREFRRFGDKPITSRAQRISPDTGERQLCAYKFSVDERNFLEALARKYVRFSANVLVSMSHERGGPWDQVWNHKKIVNGSMHISNEIIKDWYAKAARH